MVNRVGIFIILLGFKKLRKEWKYGLYLRTLSVNSASKSSRSMALSRNTALTTTNFKTLFFSHLRAFILKYFSPAPILVGLVVDTEYRRLCTTLQVYDIHACPPVPIMIGDNRAAC